MLGRMRYGFATSFTSTSGRDLSFSKAKQYTCDSIRLSQGNTAIQSTSRPYSLADAKACLDAGYMVIYDPNHTSMGNVDAGDFNAVVARCHAIIDYFADYPYILEKMVLEPINECQLPITEQLAFIQNIVDDLRDYGWLGWIHVGLTSNYSSSYHPLNINDPLFLGGAHWYCQSNTDYSWVRTIVQRYINANKWSLYTELGAGYDPTGQGPEYDYYTSTNVQVITNMFQWFYDLGTWSTGHAAEGMGKAMPFLWQNHNMDDLTPASSKRYESWSNFRLPTKALRTLFVDSNIGVPFVVRAL